MPANEPLKSGTTIRPGEPAGRDVDVAREDGAVDVVLGEVEADRAEAVIERDRRGAAPVRVAGWSITDDLVTVETDAGNVEIADPEHVQRYWNHTRLLLDIAVTGSDAAAPCRHINDDLS